MNPARQYALLPFYGGVVEWLSRSVTSDLTGVIYPTIAAKRTNQPLSGQQTGLEDS